ncbi:MAG: hypothetical protein NVS3B21_18600 [Acidimicrobiales bacterium]
MSDSGFAERGQAFRSGPKSELDAVARSCSKGSHSKPSPGSIGTAALAHGGPSPLGAQLLVRSSATPVEGEDGLGLVAASYGVVVGSLDGTLEGTDDEWCRGVAVGEDASHG